MESVPELEPEMETRAGWAEEPEGRCAGPALLCSDDAECSLAFPFATSGPASVAVAAAAADLLLGPTRGLR